jgi:predicted metal-dependent hydrolase
MKDEKSVRVSGKQSVYDIGKVEIRSSRRARRLRLRVSWNGSVQITLPAGVSKCRAMSFAVENSHWIKAQRQKIDALWSKHHCLPENNHRFASLEEASRFLKTRLAQLAACNEMPFKKVSIRNQKTRWGSCSADNSISLNVRLASLPVELMDYVLLHELVHTRIKNHGDRFWEFLHRLAPNGEVLRKKLRDYRIEWVSMPGEPAKKDPIAP